MDIAAKRTLLVRYLVEQGAVDPDFVPDDLAERASRALRLTPDHWRDFDEAAIRRSAMAYACAVRFRERLRV